VYRQIAQVLHGNGAVSLTLNEGRDYDINKPVPKDTAPGLHTGGLLVLSESKSKTKGCQKTRSSAGGELNGSLITAYITRPSRDRNLFMCWY
jgi:hypothetical protein